METLHWLNEHIGAMACIAAFGTSYFAFKKGNPEAGIAWMVACLFSFHFLAEVFK